MKFAVPYYISDEIFDFLVKRTTNKSSFSSQHMTTYVEVRKTLGKDKMIRHYPYNAGGTLMQGKYWLRTI